MKKFYPRLILPLITVIGRAQLCGSSSLSLEDDDHVGWRHHGIDVDFAPVPQEDHMTIANMSCDFFTQPLNHFVPRGASPSYEQRYCIYTNYATNNDISPILFYTGNESPLEQYINHTGLMWELAPKLKARVVFVEHRYEGLSLPNVSSQCLSYASTIQALADYAKILEEKLNPGTKAPVIAFGGSYGGMLSAWIRMKYPHLIAGAIAASAPIGAFPQNANDKIDWSARVLTFGMNQAYPPDRSEKVGEQEANFCASNLLAAWPLITWLVSEGNQGGFLQEAFSLCNPVKDEHPLLKWAQSIWFDLAEGSFPYPSSYIPFALIHRKVNLPPWPMQAACWDVSNLHKDWGVRFTGNLSAVDYQVEYGDSGIVLNVDWDKVTLAGDIGSNMQLHDSQAIRGLLTSVRDAVSIWYNITKDVKCYNISEAAPNWKNELDRVQVPQVSQQRTLSRAASPDASQLCHDEMKRVGSWEPLCCNDEMNLVITEARGVGHDFFWPPSHPRGADTYEDLIRNVTADPCPDPHGIYGYSKEPYELLSTWLDTYYGGIDMWGHSNIVFSNGLLDPWSAGGVYKTDPFGPYDGPYVQNITENDVVAVIIKYGGHHTDLMYSNKADPVCVTEAREIEAKYIAKWINDWSLH